MWDQLPVKARLVQLTISGDEENPTDGSFTLSIWGDDLIQRLYRLMIELTNRKWSSALLKSFARSRVSKAVVHSFAKIYRINQEEMEKDLRDFGSLHDFFIRKLKPEARNIAEGQETVISPVDAIIEDFGTVRSNHQMIVKGKPYSLLDMLGHPDAGNRYLGGTYMVLYLSPAHYHRIHSPINGIVLNQWTLGNRSYPVNRLGLKYGKDTLAKNYRTITEIGYSTGQIALVKVGAMFVNSIETTHKSEKLQKGEEIAYFSFGSTVVLLFEKDAFQLRKDMKLPYPVHYGEEIGKVQ